MRHLLTIQTLGAATVPVSLILADLGVRMIDAFPGSAAAWYLHLAVFAPLAQVREIPSPLAFLLDPAAATASVLLLLLTLCVHLVRFRLGVAILAHLAFAASVVVARAWVMDPAGRVMPSLLPLRECGGTGLVALLLVASGLACLLSHLSFILAILAEPARGVGQAGEQPHHAQAIQSQPCRLGPHPYAQARPRPAE